VPPPPPEEIIYVDRPVLYFDDPEFDFDPPPPVAVIFLQPRPRDFIELPPPPPPVGIFLLPTPAFVPVPAWVNPPHDVLPPPDNVIFNNIHNTTIIDNTTINENNKQGGGLTTGQKLTAGAVGLGAGALAAEVMLPPSLQKKAATLQQRNPGGLPLKPGQDGAPGQQQGGATPLSKTLPADKLTGHALPGADGKTLPLVNGKPVLNGQNLHNNPNLLKQNPGGLPLKPGQGGQQPGGTTPLSKTLPADKLTGHALPGADGKTLPLVNGKPVLNGQNLPNNPNLPKDKSRKLLNKQGTAGGNAVTGNPVVNGQNGANGQGNGQGQNGTGKTAKFRKIPGANGTPAANGVNNPSTLNGQNSGQNPPNGKFKKLRNQGGGQTTGQANVQGSGAGNGAKFRKLPASGNDGGNGQPKFKVDNGNPQLKLQSKPKPPRPEVHKLPTNSGGGNFQQKFKGTDQNANPQRQLKRPEQPKMQVFSKPQKPEFHAPPKPQQPQAGKKPSCGHPGEPPCK
jgi:hypothetical protein